MPVEDREADADQRGTGVALQELAVSVSDQEIHRLGEQQRTQVPEVLAGISLAALAEWRAGQELGAFRLPGLAAVRGKDGDGLRAKLHEERSHAQAEIGIAIDRELLAVNMRVRV